MITLKCRALDIGVRIAGEDVSVSVSVWVSIPCIRIGMCCMFVGRCVLKVRSRRAQQQQRTHARTHARARTHTRTHTTTHSRTHCTHVFNMHRTMKPFFLAPHNETTLFEKMSFWRKATNTYTFLLHIPNFCTGKKTDKIAHYRTGKIAHFPGASQPLASPTYVTPACRGRV